VADFFWDVIVTSGSKNVGLLDSCISKYRELVRPWPLERKLEIALKLVESIEKPDVQSIPCLKLFKGLIKDQSERTPYSPTSYPHTSGAGTYPAGGGVSGVTALRNRNAGATAQG
jgi:hypothetical protein